MQLLNRPAESYRTVRSVEEAVWVLEGAPSSSDDSGYKSKSSQLIYVWALLIRAYIPAVSG